MQQQKQSAWILIAEDDEDDRLLVTEAMRQVGVNSPIDWVGDGEALMEALHDLKLGNPSAAQWPPALILLDINMPRKNGHECLREIKTHPQWRSIPVVMLTSSDSPSDIRTTYQLGGNSFIQKPKSFEGFVRIIETLRQYWFNVVLLPRGLASGGAT
jgi:CheY-like chemotaxis protein